MQPNDTLRRIGGKLKRDAIDIVEMQLPKHWQDLLRRLELAERERQPRHSCETR